MMNRPSVVARGYSTSGSLPECESLEKRIENDKKELKRLNEVLEVLEWLSHNVDMYNTLYTEVGQRYLQVSHLENRIEEMIAKLEKGNGN